MKKLALPAQYQNFCKIIQHRYNTRVNFSKTLAKNMKFKQEYPNIVCINTTNILSLMDHQNFSSIRTHIGRSFFESEVFIPLF